MSRAVLSLGSNLGDRIGHLRGAVAGLGDELLVVSGVYETDPWPPGSRAPAYLNAAVMVAGAGDARHWLAVAGDLERAAGRRRDPADRYAPRTLDVDVIMVWDEAGRPVLETGPDLTLPHPRAHQRAFVLRPWIDIQPYADLPGHGRLTDLLTREPLAGDLAGVRPRPDLPLEPDRPD